MAIRTDRAHDGDYRNQLIAFFDDETAARIEYEAAKPGASKSSVIRDYVTTGMRRKDALAKAKTAKKNHLDGPEA